MTTVARAGLLVSTIALLGALSPQAVAADYQASQVASCPINAVCTIDFPVVPAAKKLTITNFSCDLRFLPSFFALASSDLVVMRPDGSPALAVAPTFVPMSDIVVNGQRVAVYVANETTLAVAVPGQRVRLYAQVNSNSSGQIGTASGFACHISGTLN